MSWLPLPDWLENYPRYYLHDGTASGWAKITANLCDPAEYPELDVRAVQRAVTCTIAALLDQAQTETAIEAAQLIENLITALEPGSPIVATLKAGLLEHSHACTIESRPPI